MPDVMVSVLTVGRGAEGLAGILRRFLTKTRRPRGRGCTVRVVHVIDGDTLIVVKGRRRHRVRILGIDAPEIRWGRRLQRQASRAGRSRLSVWLHGRRARRFVRRAVGGRRVTLEDPPAKDRFGRTLAYVRAPDGRDLGTELICRGLAFASRSGHPRRESYVRAEAMAQGADAGLWKRTTWVSSRPRR